MKGIDYAEDVLDRLASGHSLGMFLCFLVALGSFTGGWFYRRCSFVFRRFYGVKSAEGIMLHHIVQVVNNAFLNYTLVVVARHCAIIILFCLKSVFVIELNALAITTGDNLPLAAGGCDANELIMQVDRYAIYLAEADDRVQLFAVMGCYGAAFSAKTIAMLISLVKAFKPADVVQICVGDMETEHRMDDFSAAFLVVVIHELASVSYVVFIITELLSYIQDLKREEY